MNTTKRYNPVMVVLHWLTVLLILGAGFLADDEGGGSPIDLHMVLGTLLLVVLVIRLIFRVVTRRPAWADTGNVVLNRLGELVHWGLYLVAFFILAMGGLIAYNRNLFAVLMGSGTAGGRVGFIGEIHSLGWSLAILLILGHVGAAFYHQYIIKDNLLARMWFGRD